MPPPPLRYGSRKAAQPITYEPFPEPVLRRQPVALPPAPRNLQLPPPVVTEPRRPDAPRSEPGTWHEIIARSDPELAAELPAPFAAEPPAEAEPAAPPPAQEVPAVTEPPAVSEPEPLEEAVPWEVESMTTPAYVPPRSIHDPEHDSWPVETEDGDAVPAWSDEAPDDDTDLADVASEVGEIDELVLDEVAPVDPWDIEAEPDEATPTRSDFPLDAFIVPAGVHHVPTGYEDDDMAQRVAHRLDELAQQLRDGGIGALGRTDSLDDLSRVLAAIVTGYVARDA